MKKSQFFTVCGRSSVFFMICQERGSLRTSYPVPMDGEQPKPRFKRSLARSGKHTLRVRFTELWPELREALKAGYSVAALHRALRDQGEWPGSYGALRAYILAADPTIHASTYRPRADCSNQAPACVDSAAPSEPTVQGDQAELSTSFSPYRGVAIHPSALDGPPRFFKGPRGSR